MMITYVYIHTFVYYTQFFNFTCKVSVHVCSKIQQLITKNVCTESCITGALKFVNVYDTCFLVYTCMLPYI